jgi:hypothetical protein
VIRPSLGFVDIFLSVFALLWYLAPAALRLILDRVHPQARVVDQQQDHRGAQEARRVHRHPRRTQVKRGHNPSECIRAVGIECAPQPITQK